ALATVAEPIQLMEAEQGMVTGTVPLTPIQHWFFAQHLPEPHHFNQSLLLEVPPDLQPELLEHAVRHVLLQHDALRLRFTPVASGWQQAYGALDETVPFTVTDLTSLPPHEQLGTLETAAAQLQASLHLSEGPLLRVALFRFGHGKSNRLLLVIHHLVVDGVSW